MVEAFGVSASQQLASLEITSSRMGRLLDVVEAGWQGLGFDLVAGGDEGVRVLGDRRDLLRRYRRVTVNIGDHMMTAEDLLPDDSSGSS